MGSTRLTLDHLWDACHAKLIRQVLTPWVPFDLAAVGGDLTNRLKRLRSRRDLHADIDGCEHELAARSPKVTDSGSH